MTNEGYHLVKVRTLTFRTLDKSSPKRSQSYKEYTEHNFCSGSAHCVIEVFVFGKNRSQLLLMRIHSTKGKTCGEIHFSHGAKKTRGTDEENFRFIGLHLISDNLLFL